jgi:hypothetical protein
VVRPARSLIAFGVALLTAGLLAFAPLIRTSTCVATAPGQSSSCTSATVSLVENEGSSVLVLLLLPAVLLAVPLLLPRARVRILVAVLLTILAVLGAMSIGIFLLPAVAAAWFAARRPADRTPVR